MINIGAIRRRPSLSNTHLFCISMNIQLEMFISKYWMNRVYAHYVHYTQKYCTEQKINLLNVNNTTNWILKTVLVQSTNYQYYMYYV